MLKILAIFVILLAGLCSPQRVSADRPNVLLITADDMNWDSGTAAIERCTAQVTQPHAAD